jgi:hypothetical protein
VEQATRVTEPNGFIGMVTPNRLFRNHNAGAIRNFITTRMDLDVIVDFGSTEVFQGTSSYVGCIVANHRRLFAPAADTVRVIEVRQLPAQFVAAWLVDAETGRGADGRDIRVYLAQHPRGAGPWTLLSADDKKRQVQISDASVPLDTLAGIFQGIRTGANDIFILQIVAEDESYGAQVVNGLGDAAVLEAALLQPVVFGAEVKKYQKVEFNKYLVYPYIDGAAVSEPILQQRYPQTYKYLMGYRDILAARSSIAASRLRWYELVRRRDEEWLRQPKLLIRDLAPETSFAVDPGGAVFIVGGTAVIPQQEEHLYPLLAYLNSKHVDSLVRRTTPQFRGSFQKFEPQHLQRIPVLVRLVEDAEFARHLGELARDAVAQRGLRTDTTERIDSVVGEAMRAIGLDQAR